MVAVIQKQRVRDRQVVDRLYWYVEKQSSPFCDGGACPCVIQMANTWPARLQSTQQARTVVSGGGKIIYSANERNDLEMRWLIARGHKDQRSSTVRRVDNPALLQHLRRTDGARSFLRTADLEYEFSICFSIVVKVKLKLPDISVGVHQMPRSSRS